MKKLDIETLVREYQDSKNPNIRDQVIVGFMPIVKYVIGQLTLSVQNKAELDDIHSAGVMGLIQAFDNFDAEKNVLFKTYAIWRVRGHILDFLRKIDTISRTDRAKLKKIDKSISSLSFSLGRKPTNFEISDDLDITLQECDRLSSMRDGFVCPREIYADGSEASEAIDTSPNPFEELVKKNNLAWVQNAIKNLPERQRLILLLYYSDEMTLREIGKQLKLSESRISRILVKSVSTLRKLR